MSWWRVIVTKSKIMTYCVSQIAGKNMRLKWVYINADSNRSFSANPSNTCRSRLAPWKRISPPEIGDTLFVKLSKSLFSHDLFLLFDFIYASNVRYDIIGIYLAFPGQLSNTTEIELLETKLDPYIWFTALLSEFFQRYELYILTWTSGWCLSQYCEAFSGHRSSNHQELYLSPAVLKFLQPGLDPPMFPDKLLTASFSERFWNTEKG